MPTRRSIVLTSLIALLATHAACAEPASANDPVAIVTAIYTRAAKGKGDGGGAFVIENKAARARYLSKSLIALWARADASTPKDDVGPVDFDPVTNSQDPDVKSFALAIEKLEADKATIAVTIIGHRPADGKAEDRIVRYDFVREAGTWKIHDIRSSVDAKPWSVRELLAQYLKDIKKAS